MASPPRSSQHELPAFVTSSPGSSIVRIPHSGEFTSPVALPEPLHVSETMPQMVSEAHSPHLTSDEVQPPSENSDAATPSVDDVEQNTRPVSQARPYVPPPRRPTSVSPLRRVLLFFGFGRDNKTRRQLVSFVLALTIDFSEIIAIITLLALAQHHHSPTSPNQTEWEVCGKPLAIWDILWVPRLVLDVFMATWKWKMQRKKNARTVSRTADLERAQAGISGVANSNTLPMPASPRRTGTTTERTEPNDAEEKGYAGWSAVGYLYTIVWFILAHVFEYRDTNKCRLGAPHIWWLTFGLLCIVYIIIIEFLLLALLVFVVWPLLYLLGSIVLLCLGRHPAQSIKPEIGKLPKSVVDMIPLVYYIPPPPDEPSKPIAFPPEAFSYPPKPSQLLKTPKRRFKFFPIKKRSSKDTGANGGKDAGDEKSNRSRDGAGEVVKPTVWEDNWEKGDHPFVRLEGNRASCAICLMDFDEPKRAPGAEGVRDSKMDPDGGNGRGTQEIAVEQPASPIKEVTGAEDTSAGANGPDNETTTIDIEGDMYLEDDGNDGIQAELRLEDAGDGAQPLRLLVCGHVFHKTCLDPWLTDVSGRCPVCQRPVEKEEIEAAIDAAQNRKTMSKRGRRRDAQNPVRRP